MGDDVDRVRLAELVAALSLGVDLGFGQPMEHVLRQCRIALRVAERAGLDESERATVYYTAMMINIGCHTDAHEQAKWFGDDIALKAGKYTHPLRGVRSALATAHRFGSGSPVLQRFRLGVQFAAGGRRDLNKMIEHHAAMACALVDQLPLTPDVRNAVGAAYEQWDGRGWPGGLRGEAIPRAARISQMAEFLEVAHRVGGVSEAKSLADRERGRQFDPSLCDLVVAQADDVLANLDEAPSWATVIGAEPTLAVTLTGDQIDAAVGAVANFVDLKSPYFLGHSQAVAGLAADAATALAWTPAETWQVRRAALVSGFGRLGVSNAIWDKPGPLGPGEWERVKMHPYLTERMLRESATLAPLGAIAGQIRERLDGSGYPRGLTAPALTRPARVIAAADAYQAMREPRAYRPALTAPEAAARMDAEVAAGRLDGDAVRAVLAAAGHRVPRRRHGPAGLTAREVDVLRMAARGMTNKDIAAVLVLSPKTVANHIERIYLKIGASNRAMASMFAMSHGLLPEEEPMTAKHQRDSAAKSS
jgi:HD-GYP domain-containing protein (c-di-GMP phosphodiesterase class II)